MARAPEGPQYRPGLRSNDAHAQGVRGSLDTSVGFASPRFASGVCCFHVVCPALDPMERHPELTRMLPPMLGAVHSRRPAIPPASRRGLPLRTEQDKKGWFSM